MALGTIATYTVVRETDIGYMITNNNEEFFLHFNECDNQTLSIGDKVEAFIYQDKKQRLAATLVIPKITLTDSGFVKVVGITNIGVFVDIGISKDILLSVDDLPQRKNQWPHEGDIICGRLQIVNDLLFLKMLNKTEMITLQEKDHELNIKDVVSAYVYRITRSGINLVDKNYNVIFVYIKNIRGQVRIGQEVEVTILQKNKDDYSGTLILQKELMIDKDGETILEFLKNNNGVSNYTAKSSPTVILKVFGMSKAAFKRAIGRLYSQRKIDITDNKIILL